MKTITDPKGTGFRFLRMTGTFLTLLGLLLAALILVGIVLSLVPGLRLPGVPGLSLPSLAYAIVLVVIGHLLHWLVAVWEACDENVALLKELRNPGKPSG